MVNDDSRALESVKGKVGGRLTEAIQECQSIARSLDRLQRRHGLEVSTTIVPNYAPIVLRWAEGDSWWDVLEWSGLKLATWCVPYDALWMWPGNCALPPTALAGWPDLLTF